MPATKARITISGPGVDRLAPTLGSALSGALTFACRRSGPSTFYVREGDRVRYRVERHEDRTVTTKEVRS